MKLDQRLQSIRLILSDIDGVMSDGGIIYDNQGFESKQFHVRDGLAIKLWRQAGNQFGVITARSSHVVKVRMSELGVDFVRQGMEDKLATAMELLQLIKLGPEQVCYIGDDLPDLKLLKAVGLAATVADAVVEVRNVAHYVTKASGGRGAIRELVETILKSQGRWSEIVQEY